MKLGLFSLVKRVPHDRIRNIINTENGFPHYGSEIDPHHYGSEMDPFVMAQKWIPSLWLRNCRVGLVVSYPVYFTTPSPSLRCRILPYFYYFLPLFTTFYNFFTILFTTFPACRHDFTTFFYHLFTTFS